MEQESNQLKGYYRILMRQVYQKTFTVKFPYKCKWQNVVNPDNKGGLVWYKNGSNTNNGTGAGVYTRCSRRMHTFSVGLHTTVFQAEIYDTRTPTPTPT
jgi:hypothetical protein